MWSNIFHYILYSSEGLLVKSLNNIFKSFENVVRDDPMRIEVKSEKETCRRFIYLTEIIMRILSPRMLKVFYHFYNF